MSEQDNSPALPQEVVDLCKVLLQACKDAGCSSVDIKLNPGWREGFSGQVQVQWSCGRHGEKSSCVIRTELITRVEV